MKFEGKITNKIELPDGRLDLEVTFTDGVDVVVDKVIPQDKNGLEYWVTQRAESLTTSKLLKNEDNIGVVIERTVAPDTRTDAEKARGLWFDIYNRLGRLESLSLAKILTGQRLSDLNKKIADAKTFLDANIKVEYLDVI